MSIPDETDEDLLDAYFGNRSDPAPLGRLHERHYRGLVSFFRRLGAREPDPFDLAEDVFLRLMNTDAPYRRTDGHAKPWLYKIARNLFLDLVRRRRFLAYDDCVLIPVADPARDPLADLALSEEAGALLECVEKLPPNQRAALHLYYWEGLNYGEIADILGEPVTTVTNWIHRAKRGVRECMRRRGFGKGDWR